MHNNEDLAKEVRSQNQYLLQCLPFLTQEKKPSLSPFFGVHPKESTGGDSGLSQHIIHSHNALKMMVECHAKNMCDIRREILFLTNQVNAVYKRQSFLIEKLENVEATQRKTKAAATTTVEAEAQAQAQAQEQESDIDDTDLIHTNESTPSQENTENVYKNLMQSSSSCEDETTGLPGVEIPGSGHVAAGHGSRRDDRVWQETRQSLAWRSQVHAAKEQLKEDETTGLPVEIVVS